MIDVAVAKPDARQTSATMSASFPKAFNSVSNIVFAYAGHVSFFSFISEFRNPREFPKALYLLQASDTAMYLVVALVVYWYTGPNVESPALGSATGVVKKVAWGIAIPTILISGVIYGHVATKYIFVRLFRGTPHLSSGSWFSWSVWAGIALVLWIIAWILAERYAFRLITHQHPTNASLVFPSSTISSPLPALFSPPGSRTASPVYFGCFSTLDSGFHRPERFSCSSSTWRYSELA